MSLQPKGKKQIADMTLESKVLLKRLEPIGLEPYEIDLPRAEVNHMVRRDFMSTVYGGSMQATCPDIAQEKLEQHGMNDFMYLKLDYHPFAPQTPGGCGLFFSTQEEVPGDLGLKRVFTRDLRKPHWQYMGQYDVKTAASLSLNEWLDQSVKVLNQKHCLRFHCSRLNVCFLQVRSTWAKNIQKNNWGNVCARVQARKVVGNEHEPTSEDVEAIIHDKSWGQITVEEVREAFDVGKEVRKNLFHYLQKISQQLPGKQRIAVWTMKCVGYDRAFQLELCEKSPPEDAETQTRDVKEETKDGILKGVKQESPTRAPSKGKKRKLDTRMKDEDGEDLDSEDEVLRKIRSRGTRSRPIRVN